MSEGKKKVPAEGDGGDVNFQTDDWGEADGGGEEADGREEANEGERGSNETCKK